MVRALYFLRVLVVSFEIIALGACAYLTVVHDTWLNSIAASVAINDEMLKFLMLLPLGLAAWVLNELRQLVFENETTAKVLIKWPDYWRLKCHIWTAVMYAVVFSIMSAVPWLSKSGISTGTGIALFVFGTAGQLIVAISVYLARFTVREITIDAK